MDLERLIATLAPVEVLHQAPVDVLELTYDTRAVVPGALFFCVRGEHVDGHDLAMEAVAAGAAALVVERPLDLPVPQLVVADSRRAMAEAAGEFFGHPSHELRLAGVTGTNGKTTTAFLLFAVLAAAGLRPGLLGTVEVRVGGERRPALRTTPEAIDLQRTLREMLDAGDRSCAIEATSHGSALGRLAGTRFAALVFTNLTQDHLDLHGSMERYFDAKRRLFVEGDPPPAAVNVGDAYGRRLADELRTLDAAPLLTFALDGEADVTAERLEVSPRGARLVVAGIELESPLLGRFNAENVLGTVAAARLLGLPDEAVARGIASVRGVPGRFEPVDEGQPFLVVVDYSHTPDSLETALRHGARPRRRAGHLRVRLRRRPRPRQAPVDGPGRIGGERSRDRHLRQPAQRGPDAIIREVLEGVTGGIEVEADRAAAIAQAIEAARPGDVVLVAGKGHEQGQESAGKTVPFDDREVARDALRRLGART